ncbi:hypothetical protein C8Q76DRAFT_627613 [Earliella scabrosa]|nr:hypothetical protein C8Q76DRAFT_627613 [Earliella scabrosa]
MERRRGLNRGSYIWGRSVHNTRIERLWYDVTKGFGGKWKVFFLELEQSYGLEPERPQHIWLIHHLFLPCINQDAQEWCQAWNAHRLHLRGEPRASPRELFMFGMVRHGPRGLQMQASADDTVVDDLVNYGVDWDVLEDDVLMRHHFEHNPLPPPPRPFSSTEPPQLSDVTCDPPRCPLSAAQVAGLNAHLARRFDLTDRDMLVRRNLWSAALEYCNNHL